MRCNTFGDDSAIWRPAPNHFGVDCQIRNKGSGSSCSPRKRSQSFKSWFTSISIARCNKNYYYENETQIRCGLMQRVSFIYDYISVMIGIQSLVHNKSSVPSFLSLEATNYTRGDLSDKPYYKTFSINIPQTCYSVVFILVYFVKYDDNEFRVYEKYNVESMFKCSKYNVERV